MKNLSVTALVKASPSDGWFDYPTRVYPHHTDYSGVVWHGTYLQWMETARVECLRAAGFSFEEVVASGVDLPVVEINIRYLRSAKMGDDILVRTRLLPEKLRLVWEYEIRTPEELCITATVTLVAVDLEKRKVLRALPPSLEGAIAHLTAWNPR